MVLADYRANGWKTSRRIEETYRLHLIPFFSGRPASTFGRMSPAYRDHRLDQGAAPATIRLELMHLSRGLSLAALYGRIDSRPMLASIRVRNARRVIIPESKLDELLAALPSDVRDVVEMLVLTGWRTSEVTGLLWASIDRRSCEIRLDGESSKNGRARVFPFRQYPRLERLILRRLKKTLDAEAVLGVQVPFVFHRRGERIRRFYRSWRTACRRAGLDGTVPHDLRRLAIVIMRRAGVDDQTAMSLTGHLTRSMHDRYGIVEAEDLQEGTRRLSARIESSRPRIEL